MSHDVPGHEPSAAPTRGAQPALPQAYVELVSRLEDMDVYVHQITAHWPKAERHGLAADVRRQVTLLHRLVAVAWKRKSKSGALFELDVELYKHAAQRLLAQIDGFVSAMGLVLNPKSGIWPLKRGCTFCGYRVLPTHVAMTKTAMRRWRTRLKSAASSYRTRRIDLARCRQTVLAMTAVFKHARAARSQAALLSAFVLP